jgi:antitoxin VapB
MSKRRRVKLFRHGRSQIVRIPPDFELPGNEATIYRDGSRLVLEPARRRGLAALLRTMKPLGGFPDIDDPPPERK